MQIFEPMVFCLIFVAKHERTIVTEDHVEND
jgi:hypothetical protein